MIVSEFVQEFLEELFATFPLKTESEEIVKNVTRSSTKKSNACYEKCLIMRLDLLRDLTETNESVLYFFIISANWNEGLV